MPLGLTAASSFAFGFVLCIAASKRNSGTQMYQLPFIHEQHTKFEKTLPPALDVYKVNVQSMRKIAKIVCFSESPNFTKKIVVSKITILISDCCSFWLPVRSMVEYS